MKKLLILLISSFLCSCYTQSPPFTGTINVKQAETKGPTFGIRMPDGRFIILQTILIDKEEYLAYYVDGHWMLCPKVKKTNISI